MQKKRFNFLFFSILFCLLFSCSTNNDPVEEEVAPSLNYTIPANKAIISPQTESVRFIFDREIIVVNKSKITLNNQVVSEALSSKDTLIVPLGRLSEKTEYTLTVEKSAIKAMPGKLNTEVFSIQFTTSEFPKVETPALAVKNPSPEAKNLYKFLWENYGKKTISGIMANVNWNIEEAEWVHTNTGKYPALNGFDYIHLQNSPSNWIDYGNTKVVEDWWQNKGIVSAMWHWNVPVSNGSSMYAFYTPNKGTPSTDFDIREAVKEGTNENKIIKTDLEKIAGYLLLLKQKNIPVLWRPLHEAAGGWFWWGAKGAEPCKALWKLMFETFEAKGLNNLIWIWTVEPNDNAWYPGDEYVDIIGRDIYGQNGNTATASQVYGEYTTLKTRYPNKIITLSECGSVAGVTEQWNAGATWSWFMPWYDPTNHSHAGTDWWKAAFANDKVISREQMPSLK